MIILLGGEKGGTGKSTLATNFAAMLAGKGRDVMLLDCDPQFSASAWYDARIELGSAVAKVHSAQKIGEGIKEVVRDLSKRYQDIIIDAGGRNSRELRSALVVCDVCVTPMQASSFDTWTVKKMAELVEDASDYNENLKCKFVITRSSTNPRSSDVREAKEYVANFPRMEILNSTISDRVVFKRAAGSGVSVVEVSADQKADSEINALLDEIWKE